MVNCCIKFCHSSIDTYMVKYLGITILPPCYRLVTHKCVFLLCPGGAYILSEAARSTTKSSYNNPSPSAAALNAGCSAKLEVSHS